MQCHRFYFFFIETFTELFIDNKTYTTWHGAFHNRNILIQYQGQKSACLHCSLRSNNKILDVYKSVRVKLFVRVVISGKHFPESILAMRKVVSRK